MLPVQWDILAAHTEVYPEHNAWYREEIAQMTGGGSTLVTCTIDVTALVIAELDLHMQVIEAAGVSLDEAIERLYQKVYAWWCMREQETRHACAS